MNTQRTKLVHCNAITYVYHYEANKNITAFRFEDEAVLLHRSLVLNFANDYVGASFTLTIDKEDVPFLQNRLDTFLSRIARKGLKYIAVLDLNREQPCVHLLTNRSNKRTNEQLTILWGNTVTKDRIYFEELCTRYTTAVKNTGMLSTPYIFSSKQLQEPCVLHNHVADDFLYKRGTLNTNNFNVYEIIDEQHGVITVTEYQSYLS